MTEEKSSNTVIKFAKNLGAYAGILAAFIAIVTNTPVAMDMVYDITLRDRVVHEINQTIVQDLTHSEEFIKFQDSLDYDRVAIKNYMALISYYNYFDPNNRDTIINGLRYKVRKGDPIIYTLFKGFMFPTYPKPMETGRFLQDSYGIEWEARE